MHALSGRVPRRASVDHDHRTACSRQDQRTAEPRGSATYYRHVTRLIQSLCQLLGHAHDLHQHDAAACTELQGNLLIWQTIHMSDDVSSVLEAVGPRLRALRRERETTLTDLSAATGISVSTLSRL